MTSSAAGIVSTEELLLYLGADDAQFDQDRAMFLIQLAVELCEAQPRVPTPLPAAARTVVLDVVARAYSNVMGLAAKSQTTGPFSESETYTTSTRAGRPHAGGLWLTDSNRAELDALVKAPRATSMDYAPTAMLATPCQYWPSW